MLIDNVFDLIYEMARDRRKAENDISSLADPIINHLIKILKWKDEINYNPHIHDINNWLFKIQRIRLKGGRRPKTSDYYKWIFEEILGSANDVTNIIRRELKDYHSLKEIRTDVEVYRQVQELMKKITADLSDDKFEGIENYLPDQDSQFAFAERLSA